MTCFPKGSSILNLWSSHEWLRFLSNVPHNSASLLCTVPFLYSKAESIFDFVIKKIRMYRSDNKRELEYLGHYYGVQSVKVYRLGILAESRDAKEWGLQLEWPWAFPFLQAPQIWRGKGWLWKYFLVADFQHGVVSTEHLALRQQQKAVYSSLCVGRNWGFQLKEREQWPRRKGLWNYSLLAFVPPLMWWGAIHAWMSGYCYQEQKVDGFLRKQIYHVKLLITL